MIGLARAFLDRFLPVRPFRVAVTWDTRRSPELQDPYGISTSPETFRVQARTRGGARRAGIRTWVGKYCVTSRIVTGAELV